MTLICRGALLCVWGIVFSIVYAYATAIADSGSGYKGRLTVQDEYSRELHIARIRAIMQEIVPSDK